MNYTIEYFHKRVKAEIEGWPVGIMSDFARIAELLMEFGPNHHSGAGTENCPETNEGGPKWLT